MDSDAERLLDDVGWRILAELQENARLSFSELGRRVGLTAPAVAERVRRMEEAGIIVGYRLEVNPAKVGLPVVALVRITTRDDNRAQFGYLAREWAEVLECHRVTGDDCYILKVAVPSVGHLEALLDRIQPHGQTTTCLVLSSPVARRVVVPREAQPPPGAPDRGGLRRVV